jgi:hypothetical protein
MSYDGLRYHEQLEKTNVSKGFNVADDAKMLMLGLLMSRLLDD